MAELILKLGDRVIQSYQIDKGELRIGRARDNEIVIDNISVSRNHAKINREGGDKYFLTDLKSSNGTLVNGVRVSTSELLHDDQITVGKHVLQFVHPESEQPSGISGLSHEELLSVVPVLEVHKGKQQGKIFRLEGAEISLGRSSDNQIRIHDWFVSKRHALLLRGSEGYSIRDLDSWRGTTINGTSVRENDLRNGDEIVLGTTTLRYRLVPPDQLPPESDIPSFADISSEDSAPPAAPEEEVREEDAGDEFSPMTDEEMAALEAEADLHEGTPEEEAEARRAAWEFQESEEEFLREQQDPAVAGQRESEEMLSLDGIFTEEADATGHGAAPPTPEEVEDLDKEEEAALFQGEVSDPGEKSPPPAGASSPQAADGTEVALWERALGNRSPVIRKYAAARLKILTGRDHDWESEPQG